MRIMVKAYYKSKSSQLFSLLLPIDDARIANFKNLWPVLQQGDVVDYREKDGNGYGVPLREDIQTLF